jgi:DNA repair protein RecN (Recombination protein N)
MLSRIFIQNFALIDRLEIDLKNGLQVITGETGAGKSIILGALRLIMGERAMPNLLLRLTPKASLKRIQY